MNTNSTTDDLSVSQGNSQLRRLDPELQRILDSEAPPAWRPMAIAFLVVVAVWLVLGFLPWFAQEGAFWKLTWGLPGKAAQFADSFGFVNSLFSALAFAGVIMAILLQRQELTEQRKELIITQWELKKSAEAQQEGQKQLARQAEVLLNSAILSALDGIQNTSRDALPEYDTELHPDVTLRIVGKWRFQVLSQILPSVQDGTSNSWMRKELEEWHSLIFVHTQCKQLSTYAEMAIGIMPASETFKQDELDVFVRHLGIVHPQLRESLRTIHEDPNLFIEWESNHAMQQVSSRTDQAQTWNAYHRLKNFIVKADGLKKRVANKIHALAGVTP